MVKLNFDNIISLVGAFTGISGFLISLFVLNRESLKLDLIHPTDQPKMSFVGLNYEYNGKQNSYGDLISDYTEQMLLIWLQITNKSKAPITIIEFVINLTNSKTSTLHSRTSQRFTIPVSYYVDENNQINTIGSIPLKSLTPPLKIDPYAAIEGYFSFNDLNIDQADTIKAKILVKTTRGTKKFSITLKPVYPLQTSK